MANIGGMRKPYHGPEATFDVKDLASRDPLKQFEAWFNEVKESNTTLEPNAMAVATADKNGMPSVRMILLKGYNENGFIFFTNYESRKGKELKENPNVCLMFYWEAFKRSIRVEGEVERLSEEESREYFHSRPRDSQIAAGVSRQSRTVPNRQYLTDTYDKMKADNQDESKPIQKPDYWGGYLVRPKVYEFWQGQSSRLHDRLRFKKLNKPEDFDKSCMVQGDGDWVIERLSP